MKKEKHFRGDIPCADCRTKNNVLWFTDNIFWNSVVRDNLVANERNDKKEDAILCINCFVKRAEQKYNVDVWRLTPEFKWEEKNEKK